MVEVEVVTVTHRGSHELHEWHFRNTWRQALCDLCLRLNIMACNACGEYIIQEHRQYYNCTASEIRILVTKRKRAVNSYTARCINFDVKAHNICLYYCHDLCH